MANIQQQKKRVRITERQREENLRYRSTVKTLTKRLETAVSEGDTDKAAAARAVVAERPVVVVDAYVDAANITGLLDDAGHLQLEHVATERLVRHCAGPFLSKIRAITRTGYRNACPQVQPPQEYPARHKS